ncbi:hypothetical protein Hokovirus_2_50 [Hokovirus HKV1]|uniref:Uncharacterized protein n=1 Tax=Hokovirus HKV1 TaxID=1977638 RepID=A0A1V0SFN7_9VIRU|nr:hypothetical protein Hokovirus_2_50 [Hokovirus HKV1]
MFKNIDINLIEINDSIETNIFYTYSNKTYYPGYIYSLRDIINRIRKHNDNDYLGEQINLNDTNIELRIKGYFCREHLKDIENKNYFKYIINNCYICEVLNLQDKITFGEYVILVFNIQVSGYKNKIYHTYAIYEPKHIFWDYLRLENIEPEHKIIINNETLVYNDKTFVTKYENEIKFTIISPLFNCRFYNDFSNFFHHKPKSFVKTLYIKKAI